MTTNQPKKPEREKFNKRTRHEGPRGVYEKVPDSGVWFVRYRLRSEPGPGPGGKMTQGKLVRKRIGTKSQAMRYYAKVATLLTHGEGYVPDTARLAVKTAAEVAAEREQRRLDAIPAAITVGDLCDRWLRNVQSDDSGYKDQKNPPRRIQQIKEHFGSLPATELKPVQIREWLSSFKGKQPATLNRLKATISSVYRLAIENGDIESNPARDVKTRKVKNGVVRFLSPDEEQRIRKVLQDDIEAAEATHGQPFTDMRLLPNGERTPRTRYKDCSDQIKRLRHRVYELDVSLGTGLRKSEQYGLTWADIDFERRQITARDTKNGTDHTLPMIDDVYTALKAIQAMQLSRKDRAKDRPNPASADSVFGIGDPKKWWNRTLHLAGVESYRWHDNRHTFCSRLAQAGVSLKVIQEAANHKTIAMSARYAHMDKSSLASAMAVLNRN